MVCLLYVRLGKVEVAALASDAVHELLFPLDVGGQPFGRRIGIVLHHGVLVVELIHGLDDLALPDVVEKILQPLLKIRRAHTGLLSNVMSGWFR